MIDVKQHSVSEMPPIKLTHAAKERVVAYLKTRQCTYLRLSVKKTGCSGLSYVIADVNQPEEQDIVVQVDDVYFISICKASFPYLRGIEIDYVKQGLNQKFIFNNPNQTGQCGCGESFTVDDIK